MTGEQSSSKKILTVYVQDEAHVAAAEELFMRAFKADSNVGDLHLTPGIDLIRNGGYEAFKIIVEKDPVRPFLELDPHSVIYTR